MPYPCQYCGMELSRKGNVARHQKTSKYCIAIQREQGVEPNEECHVCECGSTFNHVHVIRRHRLTCSKLNPPAPAPSEIQEEKQPAVTKSESVVKERLVKSLVQTEVRLQSGIVDVVTRDEIIEIKKASLWKHALGQILAYAFEPECQNKSKRIHLFGSIKDKTKIVACCTHYGVSVSFDEAVPSPATTPQHQIGLPLTS